MTKEEKRKLKTTFKGWEMVQNTARLCAMNLMLHEIGGDNDPLSLAMLSLPTPVNDLNWSSPILLLGRRAVSQS